MQRATEGGQGSTSVSRVKGRWGAAKSGSRGGEERGGEERGGEERGGEVGGGEERGGEERGGEVGGAVERPTSHLMCFQRASIGMTSSREMTPSPLLSHWHMM